MSFFDILKPSVWRKAKWDYDVEKAILIEFPEPKNEYEDTSFEWHVVGESNYQKSLALAFDICKEGNKTLIAMLKFEPDNPYDKHAIMVKTEGNLIGYLSREDALTFRNKIKKYLKKRNIEDADTFLCPLKITGGHIMKNGSQAYFGATIELPFTD